ncbi:MAG: 30S ribosomal protein S16 [Anaerolineales bacterium]|nr:30S ribosomal protein S16 [Anaerolineales bacterium]
MVRIRLRRAGGKGQPTHRIVAANRESPRDGRFIEILGDYNPRTEPSTIRTKEDRIYYWLSVGAQPSDAVLQIFRVVGLMERYQRYKDGEDIEVLVAEGKQVEKDRNVDPRTRRDDLVKVGSPKKKEEPVEEVAVDAEADVPDVEAEAEVAETEADVPDAVAEPAADEVEEQEVQEEPEADVPDAEADADVPDAEAEAEPQAEEVVDAEAPVEEVAEVEPPQADVEEEVEEKQVEAEEAPGEETVEAEIEVKITDAAKKLAEENGIDLSTVKGTGKGGAILKSDISKLIKD